MNKEKIVILIPAYEPDEKMIDLLSSLKKTKLKVIVVDDGSGENYKEIFKKAKEYAEVISYEVNRGKGVALKTGLEYIYNNIKGDYVVVTMDCDGQHSIKDALMLGEHSLENREELVLGKRLRGDKTPLRSMLGNSITRFIYKITTGLDVYDTQTGLRAFYKDLIPFMLEIEGERFEYEMNVLLECSRNKIKITELVIETIYIDNNSHSHFNTVKDSILIYKEIFKFLTVSLLSFIIDYLLYGIMIIFTNNLILSNVSARVVSSTVNFNLNKRKVFKNTDRDYKQIIKYILLAGFILVFNTIILNIFVNEFLINKYVAKILTEIILITISWLVQKKLIFKKK